MVLAFLNFDIGVEEFKEAPTLDRAETARGDAGGDTAASPPNRTEPGLALILADRGVLTDRFTFTPFLTRALAFLMNGSNFVSATNLDKSTLCSSKSFANITGEN